MSNIINQLDLKGLYRALYPIEYIFLSPQETFQDGPSIRLKKAIVNKLQKIDHTKYLFWPQWNKSRNQQKKENWKINKWWKLNNTTVEQQMDQRINHPVNWKIS